MTRKHFQKIAAIIQDVNANQRVEIAEKFADMLEEENSRFDRDRFLEACGIVVH